AAPFEGSVSRFLVEIKRVREAVGPDPRDDSPADRERRSFPRGESVGTLDSHANFMFEAASDNLRALDRLVSAHDSPVAPWVSARATLEASSRIAWLLDRNVPLLERVGRSLALRYEALRAQEKLARATGSEKGLTKVQTRLDEIEKVAKDVGF